MQKTVLSRLDRTVNKINRFISTNIPLSKSYKEYEKVLHPIELVSEREILQIARLLTKSIIPVKKYKQVNSIDELIKEFNSFFSYKQIVLGDPKITQKTLKKIHKQLKIVYTEKQKLIFTLLGYPHKMPNPLYTNSTSVDLSEIISILKLYKLMKALDNVYPYGVSLIILTENSIFHTMSDISYEEQLRYFNDLCYWEKLIDKKKLIEVRDIKDYHTEKLEKRWHELELKMKEKYEKNDSVVKEKVEAVMPTNFMTMNYRKYKLEFLIKYFDPRYKDKRIENLRQSYYERTLKESFYYLAYHQARYDLGFMDTIFPNSLRLTVAPKIGSFAINMLNQQSKMLPYYGYIVKKGKDFKMEYIVDIPKKAKSIYWEENLEHPFYYET